MTSKTKEKDTDCQLCKNLKVTLARAQKESDEAMDRLKSADQKLNILLVFVSALLASLNIIFPLKSTTDSITNTQKVCLILMFIALLFAVSFILIGLYPRKYKKISEDELINLERHKTSHKAFLGGYIRSFYDRIKSIDTAVKEKQLFLNLAFIILLIAFILFFVILLIFII